MLFWIWAGIVFVLDQSTKILALRFLAHQKDINIIPSCLKLHYTTNMGGAFSLMTDHPHILTIISCLALGILFVWFLSTRKEEKWTRLAIGLVFGGALGNLFDRFFRPDGVIDFILAHWQNKYHWPVFNFADASICVGIFILILLSIKPEKKALEVAVKPDTNSLSDESNHNHSDSPSNK